ncbi:MAG: glycosyltransferase, partial [Kiritimatiellae bacterium]|nr:glycosyltransferase [Kiritimatiellia bacterium]
GLRNRIHILDATYGAEKAQVYRDAACFCLPSRSEGLSNAILEALAFGVPVVITHDCHFPEVAEAGAGEVVERRPEEIARALESVLSDRERREQMSVAARRMVEERYNWHAIAHSTLLAYKKALERKRQDRKPATLQIP